MHHPTDRITHCTAFVTPVVEHWLEREISQWVHPMKDRFDDPSLHLPPGEMFDLERRNFILTAVLQLWSLDSALTAGGHLLTHPSANTISESYMESFSWSIGGICIQCYGGRKEMFYLTTHSTHFIYGYIASNIWLRTILIVRKETRCRHIGYSFRLAARVLLYAPSHRQDSTYHSLYYTSRRALAGTRNSSMGPPHEGSIWRPIAPWANALTTELHLAHCYGGSHWFITGTLEVTLKPFQPSKLWNILWKQEG